MKYNLSEITELIRERRSIPPEKYSDRKIHLEQVELILNNAIWAPTHGKTQPWRFHVFSEEGRQKLSDFLSHEYTRITPEELFSKAKLANIAQRPLKASVAVVVSVSRQPEEKISEIEEIEAVACAIQNILLSATAYGLASFWSTPKSIYAKEMNAFLEMEEKDTCLGIIYLGYLEGEWPKGQRKPLEYHTKWITR